MEEKPRLSILLLLLLFLSFIWDPRISLPLFLSPSLALFPWKTWCKSGTGRVLRCFGETVVFYCLAKPMWYAHCPYWSNWNRPWNISVGWLVAERLYNNNKPFVCLCVGMFIRYGPVTVLHVVQRMKPEFFSHWNLKQNLFVILTQACVSSLLGLPENTDKQFFRVAFEQNSESQPSFTGGCLLLTLISHLLQEEEMKKRIFPQEAFRRLVVLICTYIDSLSLTAAVCYRGSAGMADGEEAMSQEDWKEKCMVLEALLMKFRVQIIKIRELTADKVGSSKLFLFCSSRNDKTHQQGDGGGERSEIMIRMVPVWIWWWWEEVDIKAAPRLWGLYCRGAF